jgi:uncharacterized repeat protein (TIGR01451 family)
VRATDPGTSTLFTMFPTTDPSSGLPSAPTVTTLAHIVDLKVTASVKPAQVAPGGTMVYTLNYTNLGNVAATGVVLTMQLPTGTTFNAAASTTGWFTVGGGVYKLDLPDVSVNAKGSVTFAATVPVHTPVPGSLSTSASITDDGTNGPDFNPLDNTTGLIKTLINTINSRRWR